jgi:flagellar basal body rod protein FlgC
MDLLTGISATSGALNSQRTRLDIIAQNIANARTTRGPDGGPYQRRIVSFESELMRSTDAAKGGDGCHGEKDIERKRREYQAPKHRVDPSKERADDIGDRARRGASRRPQPAVDTPRPAAPRRDANVDPDDNIEIGTIGNSVLESLEHTEHEEASNADDVMERAYWENKSSGFAPDG